ncbi:FecCD family ABC transporter permease [Streptococcus ictaluri]|uniref:Iron chelate uptake ABC transporter, FeCT family, permease protein n=1 Tax=Streptococcus ictaluri 707-05 TaxID=764299 RepID=G5K1G7_9STRE|nr:iron chelate uptake ABC transporter, FeCT family, permease protein [Streptococcus ictaluri 707-05]
MKSLTYQMMLFVSVTLVLLCLIILSLSIGEAKFSFLEVLKVLIGKSSPAMTLIITKIRLPRLLAACLGGGSLALSGLLLQSLTKNPLADSGILGINTGAGISISVLVAFGTIENPTIQHWLPLFSLLGSGLTILVVYLLSLNPDHSINPTKLIISGVGISTMLASLMVALVGNVNRYKIDYVINWLSGQIKGDDWHSLSLLGPFLILLWGLTLTQGYQLNLMTLSDETSLSLGFPLKQSRQICLLLATALAALSVLLIGNITFIGLMAGHASRQLLGNDHRRLIPFSLLLGMLLLLTADTIGRVFLVGHSIPTGLLVSIIGAPYFLYLMQMTKQH